MKHVYLSLVLFISIISTYKSQTTIYAGAPVPTGTTNSYMPTGYFTSQFMRTCYLYKASELSSFTSSLVTGLGFSLSLGAMVPVNGTVEIYMQNTSDVTYLKGTGYSTIISPMTQVYTGNMLIPSTTNTASTLMTLSTPFNYTGGGIYVAISWTAASTFTNSAGSACYYNAINSGGNMGAYKASTTNGTVLNSLQQTSVRPVYIFEGQNASGNECGVTGLTAPSVVPEAANASHRITTRIKNMSNSTLTNKPVFLNVTGANPFTDTQTIPSIAPGATTIVSFAPYTPTALGLSTISVSIGSDDISTNNQMVWTQSVTCNSVGYYPITQAFGPQLAYNNNGRIYSTRLNFPTSTTLSEVAFAFANGPVGAYLWGTLQDNTGQILATTNTMQPLASVEIYSFNPPQVLGANTDYFVGLAQTQAGLPGITVYSMDNTFVPGRFFISNPNGSSLSTVNNYYFAIQPILVGPALNVTPPNAVICSGESLTLTANAGLSYTWSSSAANPISNSNTSEITVIPTSNEVYTLTAKDGAGCSGRTTVQVDLNNCLGIKNSANNEALSLYPNPAQDGQAFLIGLNGTSFIRVLNMFGEVVIETRTTDDKVLIDLNKQPAGTYLVQVSGQNKKMYTLKLINP